MSPLSPATPRLPIPVGPDEETWRAMSPRAREAFLLTVIDSLSDPRDMMSEGRPHKKAKSRAVDMLGLHFKALGRTIYLAEELAVVYPGEESFSPDVLAVVGVEQPEDDERMAWVVADEGRGLDLVLEVLHRGDRNKDLVTNVERYARLGVPEYFVYDRAQQRVHGFRLAPGARRYQRVVPQGGRYASQVLGLDLAVDRGSLRFFHGMSELFGTDDLVARLTGMVERLEARADAEAERAQQEAERAQQEAERAQQEAERAQQEAERAQREAARAQQEAERAQAAVDGLRASVFAALDARGIACSERVCAQVLAADDPALLQRWLLRALTATRADDVLAD